MTAPLLWLPGAAPRARAAALAFFGCLVCFPASAQSVSFTNGPVTIPSPPPGQEEKQAFTATFGSNGVGTCRFYATEFFGNRVIWAGGSVKNSTTNRLHFAYSVAFFDAQTNLVGAASEASHRNGLDPGETAELGQCLIPLPKAAFQAIRWFQAALYCDDQAIGSD